MVVETGQGQSAGGKRPTLVAIDDQRHHVLTLDLSGDDYRGALITLRGRVIRRATCSAGGLRGERSLDCVYRLVDELQPAGALLGIGVATPGLVDPQRGIVLRAVNRGWIDLPLRQMLTECYERPVYVANDSPVSYTHLDVYKRQIKLGSFNGLNKGGLRFGFRLARLLPACRKHESSHH